MPLIHDNPWLIEQLLAAAQAAAPPPPAPLPLQQQQQEVVDALHAVLGNLKDQLDPTKNSIDHSGATELASTHMESMGDLVHWLVSNATKVGGVQIVYPGNVQRPGEDYGYYKIEPGTEIVAPLARPDRSIVAYWINADALKRYLVSLQSDEKLRTNVIFQVQLLKLIQDANKQLDADISEKYETPEKPDNYPIDQVPKVLMANDSKPGTELLTYGDLKSREALTSWLTGHNIGLGSPQNTLAANPDKFDLCGAVNVLYYRASRHLQTSARPEDTERFKIYMARIEKVGSEMSCQLTGQPGQQAQQQQQSGGHGQPGDMGTLQELAGEQIFDIDSIDLDKIGIFADKYAGWANRPDVSTLRDQIHNSISKAKAIMAAPGIIQVTNMSRDEFRNLCKNGAAAKMLANTLTTVVSYGGRMVMDLANMIERNFRNGPAAARNLREQVAQGGPQQSNLTMLEQMSHLA